MESRLQQLYMEYADILNIQQFDPAMLDRSLLDKHIVFLDQLSRIENSGISVFDMHLKQHVFASYSLSELLGYDSEELGRMGTDYFNSRVHPEDLVQLLENGISLMQFLYTIPAKEKKNYKFLTEYRVLNSAGKYMRIIEQHQALEVVGDSVWLALSVVDISPGQDESSEVKYQMINFRTGTLVPQEVYMKKKDAPGNLLTSREKEVFDLMKGGLLSKEISGKLSISVHTVNTHRQRILGKLGANNTVEAIRYATDLGLSN